MSSNKDSVQVKLILSLLEKGLSKVYSALNGTVIKEKEEAFEFLLLIVSELINNDARGEFWPYYKKIHSGICQASTEPKLREVALSLAYEASVSASEKGKVREFWVLYKDLNKSVKTAARIPNLKGVSIALASNAFYGYTELDSSPPFWFYYEELHDCVMESLLSKKFREDAVNLVNIAYTAAKSSGETSKFWNIYQKDICPYVYTAIRIREQRTFAIDLAYYTVVAAVKFKDYQEFWKIYEEKLHLGITEAILISEQRTIAFKFLCMVHENIGGHNELWDIYKHDLHKSVCEALIEPKEREIAYDLLQRCCESAININKVDELWEFYSGWHDGFSKLLLDAKETEYERLLPFIYNCIISAVRNNEMNGFFAYYFALHPAIKVAAQNKQLRKDALTIAFEASCDLDETKEYRRFWSCYCDLHEVILDELKESKDKSLALGLVNNAAWSARNINEGDSFWSYYVDIHPEICVCIREHIDDLLVLKLISSAVSMSLYIEDTSTFSRCYKKWHNFVCESLTKKAEIQSKAGNVAAVVVLSFSNFSKVTSLEYYNDFMSVIGDSEKGIDSSVWREVIERNIHSAWLGYMNYEFVWSFCELDWCHRSFECNSRKLPNEATIFSKQFLSENIQKLAWAVDGSNVSPALNSFGRHLPYSRVSSNDVSKGDDAGVGAIATLGLLYLCEKRNKDMQSPVADLEKLKSDYNHGIYKLWSHYLRIYLGEYPNFQSLPSNKPGFDKVVFNPWLWTSWWKLTRQWDSAENPVGWKDEVEKISTKQQEWLIKSWCDAIRVEPRGIGSPERLFLALWLCDWWNPAEERDFPAIAEWNVSRPWKDKTLRNNLDLGALKSLMSGDDPLEVGVTAYVRRNCDKEPVSLIHIWNDNNQKATDGVISLSLSLSQDEAKACQSVESAINDGNFGQLEKQLDQAYEEVQLEASRTKSLLVRMKTNQTNIACIKKINPWINKQKGELTGLLILGSITEIWKDIIEVESGDILSETLPQSEDTYQKGTELLELRIGQMMRWQPGWLASGEEQEHGWMEPLSLHEWSSLLLGVTKEATSATDPKAVWHYLERQRSILGVFENDNQDILKLDKDAYKVLFASMDPNVDLTTDKSWPALDVFKNHIEKVMPPIQPDDVAKNLEKDDVLTQLYWGEENGGQEILKALVLDNGALDIWTSSIQFKDRKKMVQSVERLKDNDLPEWLGQIATWLNQILGNGGIHRVIFPPDIEALPYEADGAKIIREVSLRAIVRPVDDPPGFQGGFVASLHKRDGRFLLPAVECNHVATTMKQSTGTDPELIFERVGIVYLLGQFSKRRWVHLNTHGEYINDSPLDSRLLLGGGQTLPLWLLAGRRISSEVVVLSACSSVRRAFEQDQEHEQNQSKVMSAIGIGGAIRAAGARCVVGTLYPVDQLSAALWMGKFYKHLSQRETIGGAANQAREWMMTAQISEIEQESKKLIAGFIKKENYLLEALGNYIEGFQQNKRKIIAGAFVILGDSKVKL